jgi:hypothetical protein
MKELLDIHLFCAKKNINFKINFNDFNENFVTINYNYPLEVIVDINDIDDVNLPELLITKLQELKNSFI